MGKTVLVDLSHPFGRGNPLWPSNGDFHIDRVQHMPMHYRLLQTFNDFHMHNSTNPVRFQHLVAGTYKKWAIENGKKYFSVASGGGTGRTLHPDNVAAGPASYGLTDSLGRVHGDAQFAGSSSVPAHVEMMGLIGMGNNPMVGATVACAVAAAQANA